MSKDDKFLEKATYTNIKPLCQGTGYQAGRLRKLFPHLTGEECWELINEKLLAGLDEETAVEQIIEELKGGD